MAETLKNNPLVSVIIPCFNAEKYVESAVRSIMNQTYKNLEIIVTDDFSTDKSFEILKKLAKEDSRIKLYKNEKNLKIVKTLNNMVLKANGKYIARMDADDISLPKRIEKQVLFLEHNSDYTLCGANAFIVNEKGRRIGCSFLPGSSEEIMFYLKYFCPLYHPVVMGKTEVFKQNLYSEDFLHIEDYELWVRLVVLKKLKICNLRERLLLYRKSKEQICSKNSAFQLNSIKKIYEKYFGSSNFFEDTEYDRVILLNGCECLNDDFRYIKYLLKNAPKSKAKIVLIQRLEAYLWKTKSFVRLLRLCCSWDGAKAFILIVKNRKLLRH